MEKAFLSHSSLDKDFVRLVAKRLRRFQVRFDENNFMPGEDFRIAIRTAINECNLFILFASKASINAAWVKFELDEIEIQKIKKGNITFIVFILDDISYDILPKWMHHFLVIKAPGPNQTAIHIQQKLLENMDIHNNLFVGREDDMKIFSEKITELLSEFPGCIAISGLEGIGRKVFSQNVLDKYFSLSPGIKIALDETKGLDDLYLRLCEDNIDNINANEIARTLKTFYSATENERIDEVVRLLAKYAEYKLAPVIIDEGALLNDKGEYKEYFYKIMKKFNAIGDAYLVLIHKRYPQLNYEQYRSNTILIYSLKPLSPEASKRLLAQLLLKNRVNVSTEQIEEVTPYLNGYPPAIERAVIIANHYGIDVLVSDKKLLVDFQIHTFTKFIQMLKLDKDIVLILRILNSFPSSTLQLLLSITCLEETVLTGIIKNAINMSLIILEDGLYKISSPIKSAVTRLYDTLTKKEFASIAKKIKDIYWDNDTIPDLVTLEILTSSLLMADMDTELEEFKDIIMPSTLLKSAKNAYNVGDWSLAGKISKKLLFLDHTSDEARVVLFKSLIRQKLFEQTNEILAVLKSNNHERYFYLEGFKAWKMDNYYDAIPFYRKALLRGDESVSVYRELAECLYWIDDIVGAKKEITTILEKFKQPNPFILDLAAKIAIAAKDFDKADEYIDKQEYVDHTENVAHRKATYFIAKGDFRTALDHANVACKRKPPLPQTFMVRTRINVELNDFDAAEEDINKINEEFPSIKQDIVNILHCRMILKRDGWEKAEIFFNRLRNKDSNSAKGLKVLILREKIADIKVPMLTRKDSETMLKNLEKSKAYDIFERNQFFESRNSEDIEIV